MSTVIEKDKTWKEILAELESARKFIGNSAIKGEFNSSIVYTTVLEVKLCYERDAIKDFDELVEEFEKEKYVIYFHLNDRSYLPYSSKLKNIKKTNSHSCFHFYDEKNKEWTTPSDRDMRMTKKFVEDMNTLMTENPLFTEFYLSGKKVTNETIAKMFKKQNE